MSVDISRLYFKMVKQLSFKSYVLALGMFFVFAGKLDLTTGLLRKKIFEAFEGFKLVGHVMETLSTDAFGCGMQCLRNRNCRSYNSKCDGNHGNMTCELSDHQRLSSPDNLLKIPGFTYFEKFVKGWHPCYPGHSCKDILDSGDSTGDGEYWIQPEKNQNPLKVYCDMTTAGGGWLLIYNVVIKDQHSLPSLTPETSYRKIDSFKSNKLLLTITAFSELRKHLSFSQMRFYCSKPRGRMFHVATVTNSTGQAVIQYFTGETNTFPASCGSFTRMKGDNSHLAWQCARWGKENGHYHVSKWGHEGIQTRELYDHAAFIFKASHWLTGRNRWECDDYLVAPSTGDFWKIFVR